MNYKNKRKSNSFFPMLIGIFAVMTFFTVFFPLNNVDAATVKGYSAQLINTKFDYTLTPGESKTITIYFKNTGKETWIRKGTNYISMYTIDPKYRKSVFESENWFDATHSALLKDTSVATGKTGYFNLVLHAPNKVGSYSESFALAAENKAWITGGKITLNIKVQKQVAISKTKSLSIISDAVGVQKTINAKVATPSIDGLSAVVLLKSAKEIKALTNEEITFKIGIKNTGTKTWIKREIRSSQIATASATSSSTNTQLAVVTDGEVKPGAIDFLTFTFNAPSTVGSQVVKYQFAANDVVIPDVSIDIPVTVTGESPEVYEDSLLNSVIETQNIIDEPILRIGVLIVDEETDNQVVISCDQPWKLMGGDGSLLAEMPAGKNIEAFYKKMRYYFNRGQGLEQTNNYLRFVPTDINGICSIENFDKSKTRNAAYPDNRYRNILELRYNLAKDRTWVINELPMEQYLSGLGETSEASAYEFKKALLIVARTYAMYHFERGTKHASEYFTMNAYADDQVYKGYDYELRNPSIAKATQETRGTIVTYEGRTAITPYFSRSDGRTRDWGEVWGGSVAWVKSVACPCDKEKNRVLWGHGVGMSASEALCMANNGSDWQYILKYFYQGITLLKRWN